VYLVNPKFLTISIQLYLVSLKFLTISLQVYLVSWNFWPYLYRCI